MSHLFVTSCISVPVDVYVFCLHFSFCSVFIILPRFPKKWLDFWFYSVFFLVRPRFPSNHTKVVHIWAGKIRNITCEVQSEPAPSIEWLRSARPLANNDTFRIFNMGRESSLQVCWQIAALLSDGQIFSYTDCRTLCISISCIKSFLVKHFFGIF